MNNLVTDTISPLRVLFITHTYIVGVNQGKLDAIAATNKAEVGLLTPRKWKALAWGKRFELEIPFPRIRMFPAKVFFEGRSTVYIHPPFTTLGTLREFQPDILQVEQEVLALSAFEMALWARLTRKALVVFCWENVDRELSWFRRWMCQFVLRTARLIIAGNSEAAELIRKWGYTGHIEVMPQMGVDTTFFAPPPNKRRNEEFQIGFVGRLVHQKGIDLIFKAARQLRQQGYSFKIVLCGTGVDETELRQEAQKQQVEDLVVWRGLVRHDEVPQEMSQFDALVLPSRTIATWKEQFGHVLIEAMAMGIPVVGSTCGEIPNVVGHPDLVFPEGDADALAKILQRLINDLDWWEQAKQHSCDRVHNYYTNDRIAQRLINLWQQILKPTKQQPLHELPPHPVNTISS
ncbi:glycosyltransferase family 4 protein [Hassallia byssoidea VB512170]|uniref:Glycosyltransferase family 4 protein n=1 Tax=Hassallia byssoidea VB512170 TaxID=1304833 RepID=A0A846HHA2_9CYAN|nr:glycosyltransferase [Hassalia byssoidea]NEU76746.1 glycosyltransferase family 4 protein [Hassalia byssoidea VB512170]